jgi:ribosome-binding protein aMBF1 (putative translation factor)
MARGKNVIQECQICGFEFRRSLMRLNSSGLLVCPEDYEGSYDYKSHPQNKSPDTRKEQPWVINARPEDTSFNSSGGGGGGRNIVWNTAIVNYNNITTLYWNNI